MTNRTKNFSEISNTFVSKKLNVGNFRRILSRELSIYTPINFSYLLRLIENVKKRCVRTRIITINQNPHKKWVNSELTELIADRNRYHKLSKKYPSNDFMKNKYLEYSALVRSTNNKTRRVYNSARLNKFISRPHQMWKCFNEIIHNKPNTQNEIKSIKSADDSITHDSSVIANTINNYFCNIGRVLFEKIPPTEPTLTTLIPNNPRTMALYPVTPEEVCTIILNTKPNSNLNNFLPVNHIKQCLDILTNPITDLVNDCFATRCFPDILKIARVVPIFKSGDSLSPENYRPISILDDFSKIVEQCIFERISTFTKKFGLINKFQFGFQKKSDTSSATTCLIDDIR